eukprot:jgi/Ulvmu1/5183/UM021_0200.1
MPKRKFRRRRDDLSEEESAELDSILADAALPEKPRTQGISVFAAYDVADCHKSMPSDSAGMNYHEDVMEKRLQEYVDKNLEQQFATSVDGKCDRTDEGMKVVVQEATTEQDAQHLLTPAVAEVSVPGFNTAITKVSLKPEEPDAPAFVKAASSGSSLDKPWSAPWVPRSLFPKKFGKSKEDSSKRSRAR